MGVMEAWERPLLSMAQEASTFGTAKAGGAHEIEQTTLQQAYQFCQTLTSHHSKSFYISSAFLPKSKRLAARALYAFCRVTDDIVDRPLPGASSKHAIQAQLRVWQQNTLVGTPPQNDLVAVAWSDAQREHKIPMRYAEQLIEGVYRDLDKKRYDTFEELAAYSYGVASTVGLMSMHIIGFSGEEALPYAIKLGVALQLTNILRDVGEDWRNGRVYLPREELEAFGIDDDYLEAGQVDQRWREFMRFQIQRNRDLYQEALPGVALLDKDGRFAITAAAQLYEGILQDIEAHDYDVFSRRSHLSAWGKIRRLPKIWWESRRYQIDES